MSEIHEEMQKRYKNACVLVKNGQYEQYILEIQKLANEGHHDAQMCLGLAYYRDKEPLKKDYYLSLQWHKKALAGGTVHKTFFGWQFYMTQIMIKNKVVFHLKIENFQMIFILKPLKGMKKKLKMGM